MRRQSILQTETRMLSEKQLRSVTRGALVNAVSDITLLMDREGTVLEASVQLRSDHGTVIATLYQTGAALLADDEIGLSRAAWRELGVRDGDLPGMCIVRIDHAPPILQETTRAEITDLCVREGERRQGIGRRLVAAALAWVRAAEVGRTEVQVAVGNTEGQAFWRALGFTDLLQVLHYRPEEAEQGGRS